MLAGHTVVVRSNLLKNRHSTLHFLVELVIVFPAPV